MDQDRRGFLNDALDHPVSAAVGLVCILCFLRSVSLNGPDFNALLEQVAALPGLTWIKGEVWRLISTAAFHANALHVGFNLLAFWYFALVIERRFGAWKMAALVLWLAVLSSAAEHILLGFGIGLSGVVFGLFGVTLAGRKRDPEMAAVCNARVIQNVVFWLILCVFLTVFDVVRIGNLAHGVGLAAGWLAGQSAFALRRRRLWMALTAALSVLTLGLAGGVVTLAANGTLDRWAAELGWLK